MNQLFKRLGALLLVFALVVGMLPVSVAAEGTMLPLKARLVKTDLWAANGAETGPHYAYKAELVDSKIANNVDVQYFWDFNFTTIKESQFDDVVDSAKPEDKSLDTYYTDNGSLGIAVKIHVDGLTLIAAMASTTGIPEGQNFVNGDIQTWEAKTFLNEVFVGVPFALPEPSFVENDVSGAAEGNIVTVDQMKQPTIMSQLADGKYVIKSDDVTGAQTLFTREIKAGMGTEPVLRQVEEVTVNVKYPTYNAIFNGKAAGSHWLTSKPDTIAVSVPASNIEWMPNLKVDGAEVETQWTEEDGNWNATVQWTEGTAKTIQLGEETVKFDVDGNIGIQDAKAYVTGENTVITFKPQVGSSGLGAVTANGETAALTDLADGYKQAIVSKVSADTVSLKVTNGAGASTQVDVPVTQDLSIVVSGKPADENGYIAAPFDYAVTFAGLTNGVTLTEVKFSGKETAEVTADTYQWDYEYVNGKTVNVKDSLNRTATYTFPTLTLDETAPTVAVSGPSGYVSSTENQNLIIEIEDVGVGLKETVSVTYEIKGVGKRTASFDYTSGKAVISVADGEELVSYTISGVEDKLGNAYASNGTTVTHKLVVDSTAPKATVKFNDAVKGIKEFNGQIFLILDAVTDLASGEAELVQMFVTVEDTNLDGEASYVFSMNVDKHATAALKYDFNALDLAMNKAASVELIAGGMSQTIYGSEGTFKGLLAVDRRLPSESGATDIPSVNPVTASTVKATVEHQSVSENVNLYEGDSLIYVVSLSDVYGSGSYDSGMLAPQISVVGDGLSCTHTNNGDQYTIKIAAAENTETDAGALKIGVQDNAGNNYTYSTYFAMDNKAPVVKMTIPEIIDLDGNDNVNYYQSEQVVTATASDLFLDATSVNGEEKTELKYNVVSVAEPGAITVSAGDLAGHTVSVSNEKKLVIDKINPRITVDILDDKGNLVTAGTHYKGELTYKFTVEDVNLKAETIDLTYEIGGKDAAVYQADFQSFTANSSQSYSYSITVKNQQFLKDYEISATDYSGRSLTKIINDSEKIVVDTVAPKLTVTKSSEDTASVKDNVSYYQKPVTYTITIEDDTITQGNAFYGADIMVKDTTGAQVSKGIGNENWVKLTENADGKNGVKRTFTLEEGESLVSLMVTVVDAAGYTPAALESGSESFSKDGSTFTYTGNRVVVDGTAPKATLSFAMDAEVTDVVLTGFGFNAETGKNYLKLKSAGGEEEMTADFVKVTATLTVEDCNLTAEKLTTANGGQWKPVTFNVNDASGSATFTKTVTVNKDETGDFTLDLFVSDLAENKLDVSNVTFETIENSAPAVNEEKSKDGKLVIDLVLDYRKPTSAGDSEAPRIILTPDRSNSGTTESGLELFNSAFAFNTLITDNNKNNVNQNSGLASVVYSIEDPSGAINPVADAHLTVKNNGSATDPIEVNVLAAGAKESNDVVLSLFAMDHADNGIRYVRKFAVDTLAPRIEGEYNGNGVNEVNGVSYFKENRDLTLKLTDINTNLDNTTVTTTGTKDTWSTTGDVSKMNVQFDAGEHEISVVSTDRAGNKNDNVVSYSGVAPTEFIVDKAAPVVKITRTFAGNQFTDEATDYLDQEVTYHFEVTDQYLDNTGLNGQMVEIKYTVNGNETVVALGGTEEPTYAKVGDKDTYTYSFTLTDGDVLTDLTVKAVDNALNQFSYSMAGNAWNDVFTGHNVVVDMTAPVVKMVRSSKTAKNQAANGYDFYNNTVTYSFTVTDTNLNGKSSGFANTAAYIITVNGTTLEPNAFAWSNDGTTMTAEFTITDGQTLDAIDLQIKDAAGNPAEKVETSVQIESGTDTPDAFPVKDAAEGKFAYAGNPVVVDTTAPTAHLTFVSNPEGELLNFYTDANGVCYVKLNTPTNNTTADNEVTVNLFFNVMDRNLTVNAGHASGLIDNKDNTNKNWAPGKGTWSGGYLVNNDGDAIFSRTVTVATNKTGQIAIDLNVEDLAGNKIAESITMEDINGTQPAANPLKATNGNVKGIITLDRRQPTSGNDTAAPFIKVTPSVTAIATTNNGTNLYNSGFDFKLEVTDGLDNTLNAGLKPNDDTGKGSVTWQLSNDPNYDGGFVSASGVINGTAGDTHNHHETITISAGSGECNQFELTVTAVDNVGNTIVYTEVFAVDTLAPRVKVVYDNNDVQNDKYFKEDRVATITVEDINFNSNTTNIDTEVTPSGWASVSDRVFTSTCTYDVDGDYTFSMSSTDLAQNTTANDAVEYEGVATDAFTIDKTAPIIQLNYSPDSPDGEDNEDVQYYAKIQTVSVTIEEHNFRAGDVRAEFYVNRDNPLAKALSGFTSNGDMHSATASFEQGNRYKMGVNYTDLAGNPAEYVESHVFSVDLEAPKVNIQSGNMENTRLNLVTGELELSFEIQDDQENLREYEVIIKHLNNLFMTIPLDGARGNNLTGDNRKTITVSLEDIEQIKENDGLYTVQIIARDYAGNSVNLTPELTFSLNRFGSTFTTNDPFTKQFLTPGSDGVVYHKTVDGNLIIQEINPNRVFSDETMQDEGSSLTVIVNGRSVRLQKGTDYTMTWKQEGEGEYKWYVYTYEINKSVFQSDDDLLNGRYSILIYGVDEANNNNTNESNEFSTIQADAEGKYSGKIEFVLDTKAPVIITTGIESGEVYNEEYRRMEIEISDSTPTGIQVYLNEELVAIRTDATGLTNDQPWLTQDEATGIYTLNVNEQDGIFASQNVRIEATDAAGNSAEAEVTEFHVSTSWIVRMINSIWFYIALVGVAAVAIFLAFAARKKKVAA